MIFAQEATDVGLMVVRDECCRHVYELSLEYVPSRICAVGPITYFSGVFILFSWHQQAGQILPRMNVNYSTKSSGTGSSGRIARA